MKICGIYSIKHSESGKIYIGQSVDIHRRWRQHLNTKPEKSASLLHTDLSRYGSEAFVLEVLVECAPDELTKFEQQYLDQIKPYDPIIGYNLLAIAGYNPRTRRSEAFRQACSERLKGVPCPLSTRVAISKRKRETGCHKGERNSSYARTKAPHEIQGQRLNQPHRVGVLRSNADGSGTVHYTSIRQAAAENNIDRSYLQRAIKHNGRNVGGYVWAVTGVDEEVKTLSV